VGHRERKRRNYSTITTRNYLRVLTEFAKYFGKPPDRLGLNELRTYQAYLLRERKLTPGSVVNQVAALRFFFVKTLKLPFQGRSGELSRGAISSDSRSSLI
jgi:integrase/recombinase XerD